MEGFEVGAQRVLERGFKKQYMEKQELTNAKAKEHLIQSSSDQIGDFMILYPIR